MLGFSSEELRLASPIHFGPFSLDSANGKLLHRGRSVPIQRKPFELLVLLFERAGELVTRDELYARLWPDGTHVDFEHGLNTAVRKLRRALEDDRETPRFLETVAGRGYRFHGVEPSKRAGGCLLAMRADGAGGASLEEFSAAVALWRGKLVEPAPPALLASFASEADAVRCAVGLAERVRAGAAATRPRIGLVEGPANRSEALRLCTAAGPGQALAAASLVGALSSHDGLTVRDHAPVDTAGAAPLAVVTLEASAFPAAELLGRPPFVGRMAELARLTARLEEASTGRGGLVLLSGEPGIGKTRLIEELAAGARRAGTIVLVGRCREGSACSHQPLAEALEPYLGERERGELRATIPIEAASVAARIVPALRERMGDLPEPPALSPDEERLRLLDSLAQIFAAIAKRAPVLVGVDDLHWADSFTVTVVAHLARAAAQIPLLVVGSYRDTPAVGTVHPLAHVLGRGELAANHSVELTGLDPSQLHRWLEAVAPGRSSEATAVSVHRASGGNPFFVRELLLSWAGRLRSAPRGAAVCLHVDAGSVPGGVLELIRQRLAALSEPARRFLTAASAAGAAFRFDAVARAAGLEEDPALDALDESYEARLVRPAEGAHDSEFFHALIHQSLYESVAPARRVRLHRRLAEELSLAGGAHPAEIAEQYHRSRGLPGAEPGADFALEAASHAERAVDFDAVVRLLRMALDLLAQGDPRRARTWHRLGLALAWNGAVGEAVEVAHRAGSAVAGEEGARAAAAALADAADAIWFSSRAPLAGTLAEEGLRYAGDERDLTWMRLAAHRVLQLEAMDQELPKLPTDTPLRREVSRGLLDFCGDVPPRIEGDLFVFESRAEALELGAHMPGVRLCWIGDYRGALPIYQRELREAMARGRLALATDRLSAICHTELALGNLDAADEAAAHAEALRQRTGPISFVTGILPFIHLLRAKVRGEGIAEALAAVGESSRRAVLQRSYPARVVDGLRGATVALLGRSEEALRLLDLSLPAAEKGPGWGVHQTFAIANAVEIVWTTDTRRHVATLERCVREKTLEPDFRYPDTDARLSLARLCALAGRCEEASDWFARARVVLDEQGARPLRAIADFDEAWMYFRRAARGDCARARPLLDAAVAGFESIGMPGWVRRAEAIAHA